MTEHAQTSELPTAITETITLDEPIQRGKQTVTDVQIRKPRSGALRGVALTDVLQMDVVALTTVLPRLTEPALTEAEVRNMDPADLVQCGSKVAGFLLPRSAREESQ
ncbi:phage tail assembly protein [Halomonas elongata]|uniref:phage tail assembly protein n=1 Tax=Halomonas elongata TaxID=2746 RepID=UPI0038D4A979